MRTFLRSSSEDRPEADAIRTRRVEVARRNSDWTEQREELERLAAERDRTLSYLIRQAVDDYLRDHNENERGTHAR